MNGKCLRTVGKVCSYRAAVPGFLGVASEGQVCATWLGVLETEGHSDAWIGEFLGQSGRLINFG